MLRHLAATNGVVRLWRGADVLVARGALMSATQLATYDKDAAVRAKENAKHGNRAGYNEYLCRLRDQKYDAEVDKKVREAAGIVQKANSQGLVDGRVPPPRSLAAGPAPAPAPHAEARSGKPPQSTRV